MPQNERLRVWKGELKKTSGGLTKGDLIKNKRGKVVSKKKSEAAKKNSENNLCSWLRSKGDQFLSKGLVQTGKKIKLDSKKTVVAKDVVAVVAKKKVVAKKVVAKKVVAKKKAPTIVQEEPMKAGEKKSFNMSVGNIVRGRRKRKKRVLYNAS